MLKPDFPRRIHNLPVLFNNSRYFGQNNRDSKISIILIHITDAHRRDCIASIAWDFAIPSRAGSNAVQ
jgi:hypothetical protein